MSFSMKNCSRTICFCLLMKLAGVFFFFFFFFYLYFTSSIQYASAVNSVGEMGQCVGRHLGR